MIDQFISARDLILKVPCSLESIKSSKERRVRVLESQQLSKRQAKKMSAKRQNGVPSADYLKFKLDKSQSDSFPYRLLGRYIESDVFTSHEKEKIYETLGSRNFSSLDDLSSLFKQKKETLTHDVGRFRHVYQCEKLLSKYPFKGNADDCRRNALDRFFEAEELCAITNKRFIAYRKSKTKLLNSKQSLIRLEARSIISQILGGIDVFSIIRDHTKPGPGLTNSPATRISSETTKFFKYTDKLVSTPSTRFLCAGMVSLDPHWMKTAYQVIDKYCPLADRTVMRDSTILKDFVVPISGNRVTFVPKDSSTDRAIAIEPSGNVMLQLGVGSYIRKRLIPWGINLNSQMKNRAFAKAGSFDTDDSFCTIDMKMASDTISREVVRELLPREWHQFLDQIRSHSGSLTTENGPMTILYEKFSSMGNGFTFELETLIFFALTLASMRISGFSGDHQQHVSVFGDDVVCRKPYVSQVIETFDFYGFKINEDKSFISGPFRESCGFDFLSGENVRPFFLRRPVRTLKDLHFVANSLAYKTFQQRTTIHWSSYELIFSMIPKKLILPGPLHFILEEDEVFGEEDLKTDSLESCLRVPFDWALANSYYSIDPATMGLSYRRIVVDTPVFNKKYRDQKGYQAGRYHIFLQGVFKGDIVLRGVTRNSVKNSITSQWDGNFLHTHLHPIT